jgi:hypothetical protein
LFSFGGRLYIFFMPSHDAQPVAPLFFFFFFLFFSSAFPFLLDYINENVLLFSPTPIRPSHFDIFHSGWSPPGSVWIKMSDSTLINEFLTQQKDFGWNAGGWLERKRRDPRLYLLDNPSSKRHKLFIPWLFPVSLLISLSAPSETNQWTFRKKELLNFNLFFFSSSPHYIPSSGVKRESKKNKNRQHNFFHFPVEKKMSWIHQNSTQKKIK